MFDYSNLDAIIRVRMLLCETSMLLFVSVCCYAKPRCYYSCLYAVMRNLDAIILWSGFYINIKLPTFFFLCTKLCANNVNFVQRRTTTLYEKRQLCKDNDNLIRVFEVSDEMRWKVDTRRWQVEVTRRRGAFTIWMEFSVAFSGQMKLHFFPLRKRNRLNRIICSDASGLWGVITAKIKFGILFNAVFRCGF